MKTITQWHHPLMEGLPTTGAAIEAESHRLIRGLIDPDGWPADQFQVVSRVVHACGDPSIASTLVFSPDAMEKGAEALRRGAPVFCDVAMVMAGMTHLPSKVQCLLHLSGADELAKEMGSTRSYAAVHQAGQALQGSIVVVGNAPTTLWALLELQATQGIEPALVIGMPVGFVGAAESKEALRTSPLCFISNVGNRGGSPLAAAAMNALALFAKTKGYQ